MSKAMDDQILGARILILAAGYLKPREAIKCIKSHIASPIYWWKDHGHLYAQYAIDDQLH